MIHHAQRGVHAMNTRPELDGDGDGQQAAMSASRQARRHLLQRSLGSAPVLLTISSGPAIAGKMVQTTSAMCSGSTSAVTRGQYVCNGKTHVSWCNDAHSSTSDNGTGYWSQTDGCYISRGMKSSGYTWPATCVPKTKHYGSNRPQVWTKCSEAWSPTANHYEVMNRYCARAGTKVDNYWYNQETKSTLQGGSPSASLPVLKLAAHCSAAFLNCEAGLVPPEVCDQDKIREIWNACKGGGTWIPSGSASCTTAWTIDNVCNWFTSMCA
jgi:hypothetical protein